MTDKFFAKTVNGIVFLSLFIDYYRHPFISFEELQYIEINKVLDKLFHSSLAYTIIIIFVIIRIMDRYRKVNENNG